MELRVGGRCCGKTTQLRNAVVAASHRGERVMVVVPNEQRRTMWMGILDSICGTDELELIEVINANQIRHIAPRGTRDKKLYVDDADEVLASLLGGGFVLAVATAQLL